MKNLYKVLLGTVGVLFYLSQSTSYGQSTCNWKSRNAVTYFWDSCSGKKYSLNGYVAYKSGSGCYTYQWSVNGNKAGTSSVFNYAITANGTYKVCVQVYDSCNKCDTTYCTTRTITCVSSTCNWKSRYPSFSAFDSCAGKKYKYSVNGSISFNYSRTSCFWYQWTVNGTNAGTSRSLNYNITKNGTYVVCVKVKDTCNNCDTTFCSTRTITCVSGTTCNWKANLPYYYQYMSDSCPKKYYYGYVGLKNSKGISITWKVNGTVIGYGANYKYTPSTVGYYNICVVVDDSLNKCDTTLCKTFYYNCVGCNWKSKGGSLRVWDTCNATKNRYNLNGHMYFSSKSCLKYQWTVNGKNADTGFYLISYPIVSNGTYSVCVKVTDTCNNCDTTFCSTRTITCMSSSKCNWKSRNPYFTIPDSCDKNNNKVYLSGYIYFNYSKNTCFKYQWTINGTPVTASRYLNYTITKNGSYVVCMKVTDTCNNCDTSFCITKNITCITGNTCNWKDRKPAHGYWDSCTGKKNKYSLNGYALFTNYFYKSCLKYQWTVNGNKAGNGDWMSYAITANGTYSICVKVSDTCNKCDTTYCTTRTITCVSGSSKCNWKSRNPYFYSSDSCDKRYNINYIGGYIYFNYSKSSCFKYQWFVNGNVVSTNVKLDFATTKNGTYAVCLKVIDTCNNCDTSFCSTRTVNCITGSKCNWKSQGPYIAYWDSCTGRKNKYSLNAYATFTSGGKCNTYKWTVNGKNAGFSNLMTYPVSANGTYSVCLTVTDSCNNCDTTFCTYRVFNCGSTKCNWKSKNAVFITKDTCITSLKNYSVNGALYLPGSSSCYRYQWTVAGSNAGTNQYMNYTITKNGTYSVCVKVTDTCNSCDTTYCSYVKVSCVPTSISKIYNSGILKVYPNPTGGLVNLELMEGTSSYSLSNSMGQIIQTGVLENGMNTLDLGKYSTGLYLIQVQTQNAILIEKISVQKR